MQGKQQLPATALPLQANSTVIPISDERIEDFMKDVRELTEAEMQKAPKDIQPAVYFLPGGSAETSMPQPLQPAVHHLSVGAPVHKNILGARTPAGGVSEAMPLNSGTLA